jgi:hypothetical protein
MTMRMGLVGKSAAHTVLQVLAKTTHKHRSIHFMAQACHKTERIKKFVKIAAVPV